MPYQAPQNFIDQRVPAVSAAWLNRIDQMMINSAVPATAFGADPTGTADSTQALINWLTSGQQLLYLPPGTYMYDAGLTYSISNYINPSIIRFDGALIASSGMTPGTTGLTISGNNVILLRPQMDGAINGTANLANAIKVTGGRVKIIEPTLVHFPSFGIWLNGGEDCFIYEMDIAQWLNGDTPWNGTGGNPGAYFTADGIRFDGTDCAASRGTIRWCGTGVHFTSAAADCWVTTTHIYQGTNPPGTSNGPIADPIGVQVDAGAAGIYLHDDTLDNIHAECYSSAVSIQDCELLQTNHCTFSTDITGNAHVIRVYATQVNDQPYTFSASFSNSYTQAGTLPLGFLPTGGNTWAGSFAGLDNLFGSSTFQRISVAAGVVHVDAQKANTYATVAYLKQSGVIFFTYVVGGGAASQFTIDTPIGGPNTMTMAADILSIQSTTSPNTRVQFGTSYFYNDVNSSLQVHVNGSDVWSFVDNGVFRPVLDETRNIGGATNRVNKLWLGSGSGAGTECVQVDNSATTGAQTATFTATNKPGSGTTAPDKWIPINLDGTVHYVPAWL